MEEVATTKSGSLPLYAPWTERRANGDVVPIPKRLLVLSQVKPLSPAIAFVPLQKVTCPAAPDPVCPAPPTHAPFTAKQPPVVRLIPLAKVLVAAVPVWFTYAVLIPAVKVLVAALVAVN